MIEIDEQRTEADLIALRVSGRVTHDDYRHAVPRLEAAIAEHGTIRCLIDVVGLESITPRAVWDELRFDFRHAQHVSRCAVIGDREWERWMTSAARPIFHRADVRYFGHGDLEEALAWVKAVTP